MRMLVKHFAQHLAGTQAPKMAAVLGKQKRNGTDLYGLSACYSCLGKPHAALIFTTEANIKQSDVLSSFQKGFVSTQIESHVHNQR